MITVVLIGRPKKIQDKKEIVAKMTLANAYFMKTWPDPGKEIVNNKTRPSNIWTRALYYPLDDAVWHDKKKVY